MTWGDDLCVHMGSLVFGRDISRTCTITIARLACGAIFYRPQLDKPRSWTDTQNMEIWTFSTMVQCGDVAGSQARHLSHFLKCSGSQGQTERCACYISSPGLIQLAFASRLTAYAHNVCSELHLGVGTARANLTKMDRRSVTGSTKNMLQDVTVQVRTIASDPRLLQWVSKP
jgi:hypothetical protein